ncbi:MAG: efflux RND transporter periplasmic adaptor subunit, partial [Enterobacterales bacterium]|nr:efflux RND transporter periplasmic adaptor subunit [Enterobacterales bacterium]
MKVTTKRRLIVVGIILTSLILMVVLASMKPEQAKRPDVDNSLLVETMTLSADTVRFEVASQGTVMPRITTALSAEISGQITYISDNFVAGGLFQANEVLLQIDPTDYQVAVTQAQALVRQRQIEYEGAKSLRKQGYRAESELASSEAALAAAKSSLVRAEKNLERTRISLPYKGLVREKVADLGQYVNPGSRLAVTFAIETAEVRLPLTDKDLAFLDLPNVYTPNIDAE